MKHIAITGGIGSGKSYVCNLIRERGWQVYDCDAAAKRLMRESTELRQQLIQAIGPEAYNGDQLNKAAVSEFLLASPENRQKINSIVHPAVAKDFQQSGAQFMECAILFESGFDKLVDIIVCVSAPLEVRLQRIMHRDNINRQQAMQWVEQQMPQEEVQRRSNYCINNDGKRNIIRQTSTLLMMLATEGKQKL